MALAEEEVGLQLLVGADAFWARASPDIAAAKRRVLAQAMSFEGDVAGLAVANAIDSSLAADRRVLVDDYTRVNMNDCALGSRAGRRDAALRAEVLATDAMFRALVRAGVAVRVTNPILPLVLNYPCRNHKKLIVADDVAYIGGVNFSDHNFAWPDIMLRLEGSTTADFLADDFERTFGGRGAPARVDLGAVCLMALDGRSNREGFDDVIELIHGSRREIVVVSPYLTAPFTDALAAAARLGVTVRILTPWPNNKPIVRDALLWASRRHGFEVVLGPVMSHLKGLLIDGERLVLGSSNFDFASIAAEEEFLAIVSDTAVIADFQARVVAPAVAAAIYPPGGGGAKGRSADLALRVAAVVAGAARGFPRVAVDWPSRALNSKPT
jgi:cardiolipin synthase